MSRSVVDLQREIDPDRVAAFGAVRRMLITLTAKVLWQLAGFRLPDGSQETLSAECFTGIGIYARPPDGSPAEAIMINVGGAKTPAIVGIRDQKTRAAVAGAIAADETMLHNSKACVYLKADGSIEARSAAGAAAPLATKADLTALKAYLDAHVHTAPSGGGPTTAPTAASPAPTGTTVLKGQ